MAKGDQGSGRDRTTFFILAVFLIGAFLWRFFVPAHEYPGSSTQLLKFVFDAGMLVGLIGLRSRALSSLYDESTRTMATVLFWVALAAGVGLFAIRLGGDDQWATGHRIYNLPLR